MALDSDSKKTLRQKVEEADLALSFKKRTVNDEIWAQAQIELSEARIALAEVEDNDENALKAYIEAAEGFENALQVFNRTRHFARWGGVVVSYVRCLRNHSIRENGQIAILRLKRALKLLDEIYEALPKEEGALDRALLYLEQGHIYRALADIDLLRHREEHLAHAILNFENAAKTMREKENFQYWALALSGFSLACCEIARLQTDDIALLHLDKAITAFEMISTYYESEKNKNDWSYIQFELGRAWMQKANISDAFCLDFYQKALCAFQSANESFQHSNGDIAYLRLQNEIAMALSKIAQHPKINNPQHYLQEAVAIYKKSATMLGDKTDKVSLAMFYGNYGKDLTQLANLTNSVEDSLKWRHQAIQVLRQAICKEFKNSRFVDWLSFFVELGAALQAAANLEAFEKRPALFQEAITIYDEAITSIANNAYYDDLRLKLLQWRGMAQAHLGENIQEPQGLQLLRKAEVDFRQVIAKLSFENTAIDKSNAHISHAEYMRLHVNLAHLLYAIARRLDCEMPILVLQEAEKAINIALSEMKHKQLEEDEEEISARCHKAVILWRLGSYGQDEKSFLEADALFSHLLQSPCLKQNSGNIIKVQSNYALMLRDFAQIAKSKQAKIYLKKSLVLLNSIRHNAVHTNETGIVEQIDEDIDKIQQQQKKLTKKGFWHFWV